MAAEFKFRIVLITGTDTDVGKTLLTALLLIHLQRTACPVLGLKPFCTGNRFDARLLYLLQKRELPLNQINPFFFPEPLTPLVAARIHGRRIPLPKVLSLITRHASRIRASARITHNSSPTTLLIEGCGGLLAPLGPGYSLLEFLTRLRHLQPHVRRQLAPRIHTIVVSRNILGTLNHTLSTCRILQASGIQGIKIALMDQQTPDRSHTSNALILSELLPTTPVVRFPFLGPEALKILTLKKNAKRFEKSLARIMD